MVAYFPSKEEVQVQFLVGAFDAFIKTLINALVVLMVARDICNFEV